MTDVNKVLKEREETYGSFSENAMTAQRIKHNIRRLGRHYEHLSVEQKEALDMIVTKMARICTGDSNHVDSWRDIAGYAVLVVDILEDKKAKAP